MQILIVDDDDFALSVLENTLARMGYSVMTARDGQEALKVLRETEIRLVVTDWDMPGMNGVELCRAIRREDLSSYIYIIMLTGREGAKQRLEGLCAGADDFLNKPLDPDELIVCLKTADRILSLETRDLALFAMAKLAESRDTETGEHVERVQSYSRLIAKNLSPELKSICGVDEEYIRLLHQTSPLHDLGKVGIPDSVLLKPGRLTPEEFSVMQTHTVIGAQTLDAALHRFPNAGFLQMARDIAITHHEKYNGSGYPNGLAGDQIPLCGRIVAVADVYDALTSRRIYKDAMTHEQAKDILHKERGGHFDPEIVDAFLRAEEQVLKVRERFSDDTDSKEPPLALPAPVVQQGSDQRPCKILVAEDDPLLLAKLVELLAVTGEQILTAASGNEAMKLWDEHSPRIVLSDWVMPEKDGVDVCRYIRARSGISPSHFIMLTSHSDKGRLLEAYDAGVDDFLSKPFDTEELLARVRAGIRKAKLHDDLVRKATGSQALNAQLAVVNSRLERLSLTDELTGLFNRRHAMSRMDEQWALAERYGRPLSIASIDIDHFKRVNDTYGHDAGDAVLRRVAVILRDKSRGTDAVCRVGGEEFLIIYPQQTVQEVSIGAERCRTAVEQHTFDIGEVEIKLTISIGIASRAPEMTQCADLLRVADQALYAAKHSGRNKICTAEPTTKEAPMNPKLPVSNDQPSLSVPPMDPVALLKRCGGDAKFAAAVTARFSAQASGEVKKIAAALSSGDADTMSRTAHSLKSMAAYLSADGASGLAKRIEDLGRAGDLGQVEPIIAQLSAEIERVLGWINQDAGKATEQSPTAKASV
jgi:putative two-component system response regulator